MRKHSPRRLTGKGCHEKIQNHDAQGHMSPDGHNNWRCDPGTINVDRARKFWDAGLKTSPCGLP